MNLEKQYEVALNSLKKAQDQVKNGNFGRAFAHYLVVFELYPAKKFDHESEFVYALSEWGLLLEKRNRLKDIYNCYNQALHYFPTSVEILNNFGSQLLRLEENAEAKKYFDMAYVLNKNFLPSEKNLAIAKINILPRWHFRMLNDSVRNEAYFNALKLNVSQKFSRIIDIGTGCGLLSLFATKCDNYQSITAVEELPVLSLITNNICRENGINNITVINKPSTELNGNLCGYHNLLVTEIFDTALFGEHVLKTMIHAWENLLETSSRVIPNFAKVYITGLNSVDLYKKHRYLGENFLGLNKICLTQLIKEPYEAESITELGRMVTSTECFVTVNFNDVKQLKSLYDSANSIPPVTLKASKDSEIHAFIIWFDLYLDDHNCISTDPNKRNVSCWEQAIIYLDHPYKICKEQEVKIQLSCISDKLQLKVLSHIPTSCTSCFKVSQEIVTLLNDDLLMQQLYDMSERFTDTSLTILDLNTFPIFGIFMAKKGCKVHCLMINDADLEFLSYVCEKNLIIENVDVLSEDAYNSLLNMVNIYDVIYIDAISSNGILNDKILGKLSEFKRLLKYNGTILPNEVTLNLQLVNSNYLDKCWKVDDANSFGFKIAEQVNEFAVAELWELDYKSIPHERLSKTVALWNIIRDESENENTIEVLVNKSGVAHGVLYWFEINFNGRQPFDTRISSYYKIASFLFTSPKYVVQDCILKLQTKQHRGLLKIDCVK